MTQIEPDTNELLGISSLGSVQIIRYLSSPLGPYDELTYVPGNMTYKVGASFISGPSITRIYVSSAASIVNGRRNWNIPKELARFTFTPEDPSDPYSPTVVAVYPSLTPPSAITASFTGPEFAPDPIFKTRIVPSRRLPSCSLDLAQVPSAIFDQALLQPPLSRVSSEECAFVGTEKWCRVTPWHSGEVRIIYPEPKLGDGTNAQLGDGVGFPDVESLPVGIWWHKAHISTTEQVLPEVSSTTSEAKKTK